MALASLESKYLSLRLDRPILTIDLVALCANWRKLAAKVAPALCAACVKANAYGTGLQRAVPVLAQAGCTVFFVAHPNEGVQARICLRAGGFSAKIYVLNGGPLSKGMAELYLRFDLQPVLNSNEDLRFWQEIAATLHNPPAAALHFDTGMHRLGFAATDMPALIASLSTNLRLDLIMSHFVASEIPDDPENIAQIERFGQIRAQFPQLPASLANSSGIFLGDATALDLVRPGYALYGGNPQQGQRNPMQAVVKLQVPILQIREVEAGARIGYNGQYTAQTPARLATLALGYADGFPRQAGHTDAAPTDRAQALVAGVLCPFVGRTSMDLTILDISAVAFNQAHIGTAAEVLGQAIPIDDLATRSGIIGYQILTSLGARFERVYLS